MIMYNVALVILAMYILSVPILWIYKLHQNGYFHKNENEYFDEFGTDAGGLFGWCLLWLPILILLLCLPGPNKKEA
jgi:hypothetical protein